MAVVAASGGGVSTLHVAICTAVAWVVAVALAAFLENLEEETDE